VADHHALGALYRAQGRFCRGTNTGGSTGGEWDWDFVLADIAASTGWTFEEILRLTARQVEALRKRWRQCPPLDLLIANGYGGGHAYRPPVEIIDMPDGSFAQAKAANDDWYADPARFFSDRKTSKVVASDG
jgi:hypothetical protein